MISPAYPVRPPNATIEAMGDHLQKVRPGQPLRIPANAYNAFVDTALAQQQRRHDVLPGARLEGLPAGVVMAHNASWQDVPWHGVVELSDRVQTDAGHAHEVLQVCAGGFARMAGGSSAAVTMAGTHHPRRALSSVPILLGRPATCCRGTKPSRAAGGR